MTTQFKRSKNGSDANRTSSLLPTSAIVILTSLISACSSWPDHGHGGDVQVDTTRQYYLDQIDDWIGIPAESKGALETQWSLHNVKLDTLILRGARECIPARVREVVMMSNRTRRELDSHLLEDARNSLVIMHREIDELERRLIYIKRHTNCPENLARDQAKPDASMKARYVRYQLQQLLNSDYAFENDSDKLSINYRERVLVAARYLKQYPQLTLRVNGHTDAAAGYDYNQDLSLRRANAVKKELVARGIDEEKIEVRAFGEHLPRDTNLTWEGRMNNRRVHVEIIEPQPPLDYFYLQMDQQFGLINTHPDGSAKRVRDWQPVISEAYKPYASGEESESLNQDFSHSYFDEFKRRQSALEGE